MNKNEYEDLRRRAEEILKENPLQTLNVFSEGDLERLIHELAVYRIELELQFDELKKSKEETAQIASELDKLSDLHSRFILHYVKTRKVV